MNVVTRRRVAIAGLALAVIGGVLWSNRSDDGDSPSYAFCFTLGDVPAEIADVEAVTTRTHGQTDEDLQTYRGVLGLVWTMKSAAGGPDDTDADARIVMRAIRAAVRADDPAPVRTPEVRAAAARLAPLAARACEGREP